MKISFLLCCWTSLRSADGWLTENYCKRRDNNERWQISACLFWCLDITRPQVTQAHCWLSGLTQSGKWNQRLKSGFSVAAAAVRSHMSPAKYTLESHHPGMHDLWPGTFCDPPLNSSCSPYHLPSTKERSGLPQLKAFSTARRPLLTRPGVKALWFPTWFMSLTTSSPPSPHLLTPGWDGCISTSSEKREEKG